MTPRLLIFALFSLSLVLCRAPAQAETYVAGQMGVTIPNSFSNIEGVGRTPGLTVSDEPPDLSDVWSQVRALF